MLCCGLGCCLTGTLANAQGICPADDPVIVLHCGRDTVIRCGSDRDFTCPKAKVVVVPKVTTRTVVVRAKRVHPQRPRSLIEQLFGHGR